MMNAIFETGRVNHISAKRRPGDAWERILPARGFKDAIDEITHWPGYAPTPLYELRGLASSLGLGGIFYKDEGPRFGLGSFKALGGAYAGLRVLQRELSRRSGKGVETSAIRAGEAVDAAGGVTLVSATDGNHGRSLAWGASTFSAPCRIYIHEEVSEGRAQAIRDFGAEIIRVAGNYDDAVTQCREDAERNGWFIVSDTSWEGYAQPPRDVMLGYGVMSGEIVERMGSPPTHVFLQGGVGGMAASVAAYLRQNWGSRAPRVVIVEPELAPCLFESARAGHVVSVSMDRETIMAGLSCGAPSELAWDILREQASDFITIPDSLVPYTMRMLATPRSGDPPIAAGESAVAGVAALIAAARDQILCQKLGLADGSSVLLIGSEGVTDPEIHDRIIAGGER